PSAPWTSSSTPRRPPSRTLPRRTPAHGSSTRSCCSRRTPARTHPSSRRPGSSPTVGTACRPMKHNRVRAAVRTRRRRAWLWPFVFLAPLMIGVAVFYFWPILATFLNTFAIFDPFGGRSFAGLENYRTLLGDSFIPRAVLNTAVYTAIVLLGIPIAVGIASLMSQKGLRFSRFYQVLFFLPAVSMPVAVALVWRMIFNKEFGIANWALSLIGIEGPYWVTAP